VIPFTCRIRRIGAAGRGSRRVAERSHRAHDGCRLIVERRMNASGDGIVTRIRRCD
jgi:hypothetical protein